MRLVASPHRPPRGERAPLFADASPPRTRRQATARAHRGRLALGQTIAGLERELRRLSESRVQRLLPIGAARRFDDDDVIARIDRQRQVERSRAELHAVAEHRRSRGQRRRGSEHHPRKLLFERRCARARDGHAFIALRETLRDLFEELPRGGNLAEVLIAVGQVEGGSYLGIQSVALLEFGARRRVVALVDGTPGSAEERFCGGGIARCGEREPREQHGQASRGEAPHVHELEATVERVCARPPGFGRRTRRGRSYHRMRARFRSRRYGGGRSRWTCFAGLRREGVANRRWRRRIGGGSGCSRGLGGRAGVDGRGRARARCDRSRGSVGRSATVSGTAGDGPGSRGRVRETTA